MRTLKLLVMIFVLLTKVYAQEFTSPRATALGAYVGIADDIYGLDWNLAGTVQSKSDLEIAFASSNNGSGFDDLRFILRAGDRHVFAFKWTPGFQVTHSITKLPILPREQRTQLDYPYFSEINYKEDLGLGYAYQLTPHTSSAIEIKRRHYANSLSASRFWSMNLGFYFDLPKINIGLVSRNTLNFQYQKHRNQINIEIGDSLKAVPVNFDAFNSVFVEPEWRLDFGVSVRPLSRLLLAGDVFSDGSFGFGYEWEIIEKVYLRHSFSHRTDNLFRNEKVFAQSVGIGFAFSFARLDVAYYHPYGHRKVVRERMSFGEFSVQPMSDPVFLISALFLLN